MGAASEQRDFVVISRLSDIQNILGSLQIVYGEIKPFIEITDAAQAAQIEQSLADLKSFVADVFGAEAQNRATAIAGQIAQLAARLNISIKE
jgi:hypothetical protein